VTEDSSLPPPAEEPFLLRSRNGEPIRGVTVVPDGEGRPPVVFICHGFKGFREWGFFPHISRALASAGFLAVRFDFSRNGIGDSPTEFTRLDLFERNSPTLELSDLGRVLDAFAAGEIAGSERSDPARWGLLGHSRGGAIALLRAARDPRVRALVTWAAIAAFDRYSDRQMADWRRDGYLEFPNLRTGQLMRVGREHLEDLTLRAAELDLARAAGSLEIPWLILHGREDLSVPAGDAETLRAAARGEGTSLRILPGTGHTFGAVHPFSGETPALREALLETAPFFRRAFRTPDAKKT
jgi:dienelactone hydrolase